MNQHPLWPFVEQATPRFQALSDRVWATPETCYAETASAAAHRDELIFQGFRVEEGLAGIPTALMGEAGAGGPVIAFLGEFDALAGLSQKADAFEKTPLSPGGNGHGCGHNLLGAAAMQAATAVKDWLEATGTPGRVRYYGCPAEEGGAAKAFMVRAGLFEDVDVAITWHPGAIPGVVKGGSLANARVDFSFEGQASHAAAAPHLGRSALDAAELMNIGVNFLREHMPDEARIHYAFIDAGGISPNVVQGFAKLRYTVRAATAPEMTALLARVRKVAAGAAMMTETTVSDQVLSAVSDLIFNQPLGEAMQRNLERLGPPDYSEMDHAYAARFQQTLSEADIRAAYHGAGMVESRRMALPDFVVPWEAPAMPLGGSTDVADVSWVVPTVQLWGANHAIGTQLHSWQVTAQGKGGPAIAGMVHAARVMAATGADAMLDADLRARAKADLARRTGPAGYISPLPEDAEPPIAAMA